MEKPVILDISKNDFSDAAILDEQNLLHRLMMKQFMTIWESLYEKVKKEELNNISQSRPIRCHNAISITASRGAGKTTFLLSALHKIKQQTDKSVLCLNPIDPSLVEMKQHPFINIIAAIQERVDEYFSGKEYSNANSDILYLKKEFDNCYHKMLKGLPFIDGVGKSKVYEEWDDDEYIAARGMERAEASNKLEILFHNYVKVVLKILKKTCLVISFDDIDTDFKKGYDVLESIRKYLTSPQIVTIITGDLELYGKLVRKSFWKGFDLAFLNKETEYAGRTKKEFAQMIDQLENQYLVKLLKPEYRISLKSVREYMLDNAYPILVKLNEEKIGEIGEVYESCVDLLGFKKTNNKTKKEIVNFLLGLTLRVQIRILTLYAHIIAKHDGNIKAADAEMAEGLANVFWNDLNQKSSNAKSLLKVTPTYPVEMLKFLVENNLLHSTTNFLPETNDFIINKTLLVIGSLFNQILQTHNFLVFDYWLRICFVKVATERLKDKDWTENIKKFLEFTQMDADAGINKGYGKAQAFYNQMVNGPFYQKYELIPGTIFVGNQSPLQLTDNNRFMSLLPMLGTVDNNHREHVFASIYQLFAVIREALFVLNSGVRNGLRADLGKLAQYRNYQEPFMSNQALPGQESLKRLINSFEDMEEKANIDHLVKNLSSWSKKEINVSCQLLDRVFTRFYYTLIHLDLDNEHTANSIEDYESVGYKLNLYILALLNAALIEDAIDENAGELNYNNVGDIELIYVQNIELYKQTKSYNNNKVMSLHEWLMNCPILRIFINPIIVQLQSALEVRKVSKLDNLLMLHRLEQHSVFLKDKQSKLIAEKTTLSSKGKWLDAYYKWRDSEEDLMFLEHFTVPNQVKANAIYKDYINQKKIREDNLKSLQKLECPDGFTYRTPKKIIEEHYANLDKHIQEVKEKLLSVSCEMDNVKIRKEELTKNTVNESAIFNTFSNSPRIQVFANNVYKNLSQIKLTKV